MSLSIYGRGPSAKSFRIIMAADHLVWLARLSRKRPETRRGTDRPQKARKCRFNSFCVVVAVVDRIRAVFFAKPIFQELHKPSALIAQTAQKVRDGQTDPQTKRITPVAQL